GYSCKCYQMNFRNEIDSADLIFQGIPINRKQVDSKMIYQFSVDKIWKGYKSDTIEIKTGLGGQDCGMIFEIGKTYVVFAKNGETSHCRKNALIDSTHIDLKLDYKFTNDFVDAFKNQEKKLNIQESDYLNRHFNSEFEKYDFKDKSIIFTHSTLVVSKSDWIETNWEYDNPSVELVELTKEEKEETGYDAILVTWSKFILTDKMKERILKRLK
ncbi:MAG: hypothetical protein K9I29_08780, partial [Bacteroidales bacterium]|nr:hypothetical protein [Bacteroidales bacterium]